MSEQVGVYRFRLSQTRYKNGAFFWSVIFEGQEIVAFDGRFMREEGNRVTPTKNGFRLPAEKFDHLRQALIGDLRTLEDTVLVENRSFKLYVRYVNDKYGEGIDFRKYRMGENYQGWDRSGIRMKLEDVVTLRDLLSGFDPLRVDQAQNCFAGKELDSRKGHGRVPNEVHDKTVNPVLDKLLGD